MAAAEAKPGSFMANIQKKLSNGAEAGSRAIKIQTLKAEIMMKENQAKSVKQEMGVAIYAALESSDQEEMARIFGEYKAKVDAIDAEIATKKLTMTELEAQATPRE
mmetsp:Transcript_17681/g.47593  ORF Transcript_17681/g.47593 Transcript_17681/m.47593 type:complete len:106 (+) Transcript_17681:100-417(+)